RVVVDASGLAHGVQAAPPTALFQREAVQLLPQAVLQALSGRGHQFSSAILRPSPRSTLAACSSPRKGVGASSGALVTSASYRACQRSQAAFRPLWRYVANTASRASSFVMDCS